MDQGLLLFFVKMHFERAPSEKSAKSRERVPFMTRHPSIGYGRTTSSGIISLHNYLLRLCTLEIFLVCSLTHILDYWFLYLVFYFQKQVSQNSCVLRLKASSRKLQIAGHSHFIKDKEGTV